MTFSLSQLQQSLADILSQTGQPLPAEALLDFVRPFFDRRDHYLETARFNGSPLYLLEPAALNTNAERLKTAFENILPAVGFYFAVKSNHHPEVARTLLKAGFGLDVSSGLELEMALDLGARDIVFSGPGKRDDELHLAAAHADTVVILLDSWGEMHRLDAIADKLGQTVRCGLRLTVNPEGLWRKFGIPIEDLPDFMRTASRSRRIRLTGLQFHTSWNLSPQPQIAFIQKLGRTLAALSSQWVDAIEWIDIGGGYWPNQGEWLHPAATAAGRLREALGCPMRPHGHHIRLAATPIETFAAQLASALHKHIFPIKPCRICIEPGRWVSHDAMHLLIRVVDKKAPDLVIADAGTNAVGWERFESDYFPILNLSRPALTEHPCHILGSLCTPHDVWGYFYFGDGIQSDDILLIPTQGAYTYSLRQQFIKPLPKVVII